MPGAGDARAVLEERAKIARELHDVVAHHMSLIAVRAETAPYRLSGLPGPVRAESGRAPQPRLSDLSVLIEALRQAGVPVELTAAPALDRVPPAGASSFLLKDTTAIELVHAVRVVAAGDALLAPTSPERTRGRVRRPLMPR